MNRIALLSLLFSLLTVFVACEDKSISLGFNTQNPTPENYELKSSLHVLLDVPKNVPVEMQQSMSAKVEVLVHSELLAAYDDGTGRFMLRVDSANYSSDNRSVEETDHIQRYLKTQLVQYKMGSDGEMSSVRFDEMVALPDVGDIDIRRIFLKVQPVLPSSPLAVGDTWERQQMLTDDNNKQSVVYKWFKLEEVFDRDGVKIAKLRMNVRYKQNSEDDAQIMESPDFVLGSGTILFDIAAGKVVEGELDIEGKVRVIEKKDGDTIPDLRVRQKITLRSVRE
ncbi:MULTISPECIES: hypothetical protein [Hallerella]|uniref:Lipoprotein n=1 Tax=Hallerella succinigenes TaxID=1896222 RepID=A0A2M9A8G4_9BACT|nr:MULTISPECIES: hypothetical protein [Hallerella]MBS7390486.1 hypothetical protein [Fibrobacter sp.]MCI6873203.1 hypothetical protein [Hallerella sp.]MDD6092590.1 hypothetical protein [Hallerella succinigenes]MDY5030246.1 hypothetical protein [Hallerella succinigenes]PJJ42026.1 hypothetical protein BGX16_2040 [Hallerella succinigenes]